MRFLNLQTNQEEDLDNDGVRAALANPAYSPVGAGSYRIRADDGTVYETTDLAKARAFVGEGHGQFVTDFDLEKEKWEKKGIVGDVAAVGLGALSGLSFGASDLAARALGVEDDVRAIREASPIATAAGEIGSLLVPGFGTAAAAAKAGKLAATGAAKAAGKIGGSMAATGGGNFVGRAVAKTGQAVASNAQGIAKAAESVARGATMGAQQGITEVALSDVPLASTAAASTLAKDVLLGGALDLGFTLGAPVVREMAKKGWTYVPGSSTALDSVNKAYAKVASKVPFGAKDEEALLSMVRKDERVKLQSFMKDFEKNVGVTTDSLKNLRDGYKKAAGEKEEVTRQVFKTSAARDPQTLEILASSVDGIMKDADRIVADEALSGTVRAGAKRVRALLDQLGDDTQALLARNSTPKQTEKMIDQFFDSRSLAKKVREVLLDKRQMDIIGKIDKEQINNLVSRFDGAFDRLGQTAEMKDADRLYAIQAQLGKFLKKVTNKETGKINPLKVQKLLKNGKIGETPIEEFIARVRQDEDILSAALGPTGAGASKTLQQMADLAAMSRRYKAIQSATGQFTGRSLLPFVGGFGMGGVNPTGAAIGVALTPLLNPEAYLRAVDAVENVASRIAKATAPRPAAQQMANAHGLGAKVLEAVKEAARSRKTIIADEAAMGVYEMLVQPKVYEQHYQTLSDNTGSNLTPHMEKLERLHPELPASAGMQFAAVQGYLMNHAPQMRASYNRPGQVRMPSHSELQAYAQRLTAATDPFGVLQRAASLGRMPNGLQLQTIRELYPEIYSRIVDRMPGAEVGGIADIQSMHENPIEEPGEEIQRKGVQLKTEPAMTSIQRATMR